MVAYFNTNTKEFELFLSPTRLAALPVANVRKHVLYAFSPSKSAGYLEHIFFHTENTNEKKTLRPTVY